MAYSRCMLSRRDLTFVVMAAFTLFMVTPACGELFRCGCDWPWNGLFSRCDSLWGIAPGCPWCEHPALGLTAVILPLVVGLGSARSSQFLFRRWRHFEHTAAATAAALATGILGVPASLYGLGALTVMLLGCFPV